MLNIDEVREKILDKMATPHVFFPQDNLVQKKMLASYIHSADNELLLVPTTFIFSYPAVIAGLTEKQVEYVAKNAPAVYKKELVSSIENTFVVKDVMEIAKALDEDLGEGVAKNQERVKNIIRYIKDNKPVFEF